MRYLARSTTDRASTFLKRRPVLDCSCRRSKISSGSCSRDQAKTSNTFLCTGYKDTVIRAPRRLPRNPGARPWLGDFPIQIRRGLVSHLAALIGGKTFRQHLIPDFLGRYGLDRALTIFRPADAKEFKRRFAKWPQVLKTLEFEP